MKRSNEPRIARCSMTGTWRALSSATYSAPSRPGIEKSTCIVPHCQDAPDAVLQGELDLGPVKRAFARLQLVGEALVLERGLQRRLRLVPLLVGPHALRRPRRELDQDLVEAEIGVDALRAGR